MERSYQTTSSHNSETDDIRSHVARNTFACFDASEVCRELWNTLYAVLVYRCIRMFVFLHQLLLYLWYAFSDGESRRKYVFEEWWKGKGKLQCRLVDVSSEITRMVTIWMTTIVGVCISGHSMAGRPWLARLKIIVILRVGIVTAGNCNGDLAANNFLCRMILPRYKTNGTPVDGNFALNVQLYGIIYMR